ncbi:MAG: NAD-dependent epimerase/dehydratase family protein [Miltoncostaeaceae bacterium]
MKSAFVIGGTGLVGRALVDALIADGVHVIGLARNAAAIIELREAGVETLPTDLVGAWTWADEIAEAEVVFHAGLPRQRPPLRHIGARRRAREAAAAATALADLVGDRPLVVAGSALVYGDRPSEPADEAAALDPLPAALPAAAAEAALRETALRIVRLPWVYGPGGWFRDLVVGLRTRRYRIVGDGHNRWGLLGVDDAVAALRAVAEADPGVYNAIEAAPTQDDVVNSICRAPGFHRPDRTPRAIASIPLGGAMARSLSASVWTTDDRLRGTGWAPTGAWEPALRELTEISLPASV